VSHISVSLLKIQLGFRLGLKQFFHGSISVAYRRTNRMNLPDRQKLPRYLTEVTKQ